MNTKSVSSCNPPVFSGNKETQSGTTETSSLTTGKQFTSQNLSVNPTVHDAERSIALDFDGVIHRYSKGWHTKDIYDPPNEGAYDALWELSHRFGVFIFTARPAADVIAWCQQQFPEMVFEEIGPDVRYWDRKNVIGVTNRKLPAVAYVDDRGIRFTNFRDILNYFR